VSHTQNDLSTESTWEGGQITITSTLRPNDILIAISDDGIGISAEEKDLIFDKGFRGSHEAVQQSVGLGRGLYNARRLAEVLWCEIGVESEVGKGSTFWFTLPLAGDEEEE
jgi:signal transduction histidine kinase